MRLLIVIVNYRTADLVVDCLRSLAPEIANLAGGARVVVTDNCSGDDSLQRVGGAIETNGWSAWASLVPLLRNGGFAYGNNEAIRPALASNDPPQHVLLLNPDTVIRPGAVATLLEFMDQHKDVGIAGSRLEDPDGTPQVSAFRFHGLVSEFENGIRLGLVTRVLAKFVVGQPVRQDACRTDWVAGASMIIRAEVFRDAGLLDEKYFMYFEEVDFCRAARRKGWPCWYVPASRVVHLVGSATQLSDGRKHRRRRPTWWFDARRRYFVKNHGALYAALADLMFVCGYSLWRLRRAIQRKDDTDPPKLLSDTIRNSVVVRGAAI
jgi:N-acetylglucosaminyl-diphospho-decaprenol L-rhamnosyltransferase